MKIFEIKCDSFDTCKSKAFDIFADAKKKGLDPLMIQLAGFKGDIKQADPRWQKLGHPEHWSHYVVAIDGVVYDPTADQFVPNMPKKYSILRIMDLWRQHYPIDDPML